MRKTDRPVVDMAPRIRTVPRSAGEFRAAHSLSGQPFQATPTHATIPAPHSSVAVASHVARAARRSPSVSRTWARSRSTAIE